MSDCDDSFYDSFESGSDSDHADGPGEENFLHMNVCVNVTNLRAQTAFHSIGGAGLEIPAARKDLLLCAGNGERGQCDDQDDWR